MSQLLQERGRRRTESSGERGASFLAIGLNIKNSNEMKCNGVRRGLFLAHKGALIAFLWFDLSPVPRKPNASLYGSS